jgi:beta-alanine degradation protein BauB
VLPFFPLYFKRAAAQRKPWLVTSHMTTREKATFTTIEDNARVRITEWRFAPGAETGWHVHSLDYIVVYGTAGQLLAETKEGPIAVEVRAGQSYFRKAGVEHNIVNAGGEDLVFVETELK